MGSNEKNSNAHLSNRPGGTPFRKKEPSSIGTWLVALVVLAFGYQLFFGPKGGVKSGLAAPSLQLQQIDSAKQWTPRWQDKVSVLEFWASHCSVCVSKLRSSSARAARHQKAGTQHLMINIDAPTNVKALRRYLTQQGVPKDQWHVHQRDARYQGSRRYRIRALPTIVLIDQRGKIAQYFQGALSDSYLRAYIEKIGRAVSWAPQPLDRLALAPGLSGRQGATTPAIFGAIRQ